MRRSLSISILLISGLASAQLTQLDSLKVTPNRHSQSYLEAGRSMTVIQSEQIRNMPVTTVDELLRYVAGVNLNARGPFGVQSDIGMRGSTFSQVLVLIDNVDLNDPLTAHFNNYIPIPLSEIERIDVIRGPAAAAYGADAVGGVIHIQTKIFLAEKVDQHTESNGQFSFGDHGLYTSDLSVSTGIGSVLLSAGMKSSRSQGEKMPNPNFPIPSDDSIQHNTFDLNTYTLAAAYLPNRHWKLEWRSSLDRRDFAAKYFYTASIFDESQEEVSAYWHQLNVERKRKSHSSQLSLGYKQTKDVFVFNPLFAANEHELSKYFFNLTHGISLHKNQRLSFGVQAERQEIVSTDRGNHEKMGIGIYGIYGFRWNKLHSNASVRFEFDENFGLEFIPQLAVSYARNNWLMQSSIGKAVRAADFTERYVAHLIPNLSPGRNLGNPDLLAERSYTADFSLSRSLGFARIQAGLFHRWSMDLIDYSLTNSNEINNLTNLQPNENYLFALNISESRCTGLEFQASAPIEGRNYSIAPILSYTYLKTSNPERKLTKYLSNHPSHSLALQLMMNYSFLFANLGLNHIQRHAEHIEEIKAEVPASYSLLNLRIGVQLSNARLKIFSNMYNLLDTKYQEIPGAQMPGRWMACGLSWNL